jgi:hypothetical protein
MAGLIPTIAGWQRRRLPIVYNGVVANAGHCRHKSGPKMTKLIAAPLAVAVLGSIALATTASAGPTKPTGRFSTGAAPPTTPGEKSKKGIFGMKSQIQLPLAGGSGEVGSGDAKTAAPTGQKKP